MLGAASAFGADAATHYGVLESSSGSAVVVQWTGLMSHKDQFGRASNERAWLFVLDTFVKDTGDPIAIGNRVKSAIDTIVQVVEADDTIQGLGEWVGEIRAERELPPEGFFTAGGFDWLRIKAELDIIEWPNG
jgi:hypothetical protein